MSSQDKVFSTKPHLFNETNFIFWKIEMRSYFQYLGVVVLASVERGYQDLGSIPLDKVGNNKCEINSKAVNVILGGLA